MRSKLLDRDSLVRAASEARREGKITVFTNGCFDLIHAGHVRYLEAARSQGDLLIVGLNTDESVRGIKGDRRPITPQSERAEVLAALACVDYIAFFSEPDPLGLIRAVEPDILVKGADWPEDRIVGAPAVKERGGRVVRIPLTPGASTTAIIERILKRFSGPPQ